MIDKSYYKLAINYLDNRAFEARIYRMQEIDLSVGLGTMLEFESLIWFAILDVRTDLVYHSLERVGVLSPHTA